MTDHLPDVSGHVEATWRTCRPPAELIERALAISCTGCVPNVFIREAADADGEYELTVAHDETCPWLAAAERGGGSG